MKYLDVVWSAGGASSILKASIVFISLRAHCSSFNLWTQNDHWKLKSWLSSAAFTRENEGTAKTMIQQAKEIDTK